MADAPRNTPKQSQEAVTQPKAAATGPAVTPQEAHKTVEQFAAITLSTHSKLDILRQQITKQAPTGDDRLERGAASNG